ncbi:hypothetical protein GCM10025868_33260 [Angustibacter aerolatus]|uniref:Glycoside hydrolase family 13 N-terminal domain-containing protein n=1 Tax=Angustibacter aerolatus TaxID=1162965 RepID=A0ABQ6JIK0_9ACTN|nr:hypothetical protein GCM10025868_33260 [Angustibacter aerolatus]
MAVAQYDDLGRLLDATGVQVPGVLDALYSRAATKQRFGVAWSGGRPTFRVWAPTAKSVHLKVWPTTGAAQRVSMQRDAAGSWSVRGPKGWLGAQYLYDLQVYAPTTLKVERNQVTDPYSVALTTNSTRSVAVDLDARSTQPSLWRSTPSPKPGPCRRLDDLRACTCATSRSATARCRRRTAAPTSRSRTPGTARSTCARWRRPA